MECLQTGMLDHACTYTYVKTETYMCPIRDVLVFVFAVIVTQTSQEHSSPLEFPLQNRER